MKRFPLSTLRGHISAPRSNFDMVDTDSECSHQALFIQTKFASDLPECILNHVVSRDILEFFLNNPFPYPGNTIIDIDLDLMNNHF